MDIAYLMYIIGGILIIPAIIFAIVAQVKVSSAFNRYSVISSSKGMTAAQLAEKLLYENGCSHVRVEQSKHGHLSDHYDPRKKVVRLSSEVYNSNSLAAIGIAAHEVGHAIQHNTKYAPLMVRQVVIKSTSLVNKVLLPLVFFGLILAMFALVTGDALYYLIIAACALYAISFVINLITLPTEFNASARAKKLLREILYDEEEKRGVSKVLTAAAMTYVAATIISLAYLLRFLGLAMMMSRRR